MQEEHMTEMRPVKENNRVNLCGLQLLEQSGTPCNVTVLSWQRRQKPCLQISIRNRKLTIDIANFVKNKEQILELKSTIKKIYYVGLGAD